MSRGEAGGGVGGRLLPNSRQPQARPPCSAAGTAPPSRALMPGGRAPSCSSRAGLWAPTAPRRAVAAPGSAPRPACRRRLWRPRAQREPATHTPEPGSDPHARAPRTARLGTNLLTSACGAGRGEHRLPLPEGPAPRGPQAARAGGCGGEGGAARGPAGTRLQRPLLTGP